MGSDWKGLSEEINRIWLNFSKDPSGGFIENELKSTGMDTGPWLWDYEQSFGSCLWQTALVLLIFFQFFQEHHNMMVKEYGLRSRRALGLNPNSVNYYLWDIGPDS